METNEKLSDAQTEDLVMELMKGDTLDHRIGVYFEFGQFASMEKEIAKTPDGLVCILLKPERGSNLANQR